MKVGFKRTTPNYRSPLSTQRIMFELTIALLIVTGFALFFQFSVGSAYGIKAISIVGLAVATAFVTELLYFLAIREKQLMKSVLNSFPQMTALIFALILPIGTPLYVVVIGTIVAILFGKLVYGGFGQNIFNPALVGRAFVAISYGGLLVATLKTGADVVSSATPTTAMASAHWIQGMPKSLLDFALGMRQGALGETFTIVILILGIILAVRKVLDYRIPLAYILTSFVIAFSVGLSQGLNPFTYGLTHIALGGLMFGAIFMLTDPVTSPTSPVGKIIFGIGAGFITMLIRFKANAPEGVMYSILIMNMLTPMIDKFTTGMTNKKMIQKYLVTAGLVLGSVAIIVPVTLSTLGLDYPGFEGQTVEVAQEWCNLSTQKNYGIKCHLEGVQDKSAIVDKESVKSGSVVTRNQTITLTAVEPPITAKVIDIKDGGYVVSTEGFHGEMHVLVKLDAANQQVLSVQVLTNDETPEYGGALIKGEAPEHSDPEKALMFYDQVLTNKPFAYDAEVDITTGATKTSNAIYGAVKAAVEFDSKAQLVGIEGNVYSISVEGFHGEMTVKVTIDPTTKLPTSVSVAHDETEGYGDSIINGLTPEGGDEAKAKAFYDAVFKPVSVSGILGADTNTGATTTSTALQQAVVKAIVEASK